ncbi:MAG: hypothetical protein K9J27_03845 [Bacteroidales bacterium]|nr:hypothetical protein [Bacteroidales bacterium]MCF8333234.1 hypothetical protein [Bacteroidales bacterium]
MRFNKTIFPTIVLIIFLIKPGSGGEAENVDKVNSILSGIFNFQFEKARHLIDSQVFEKQTEQFLRIELAWWQAIENGNKESLHKFKSHIESRKKEASANPTQRLILQTYKLRYNLALNKYPAAIFDYVKLKNLLEEQTPPEDSTSLHGHLYSLYVNLIELVETSYNLNPFKNNIDSEKKIHIQALKSHAESNNYLRSTLGKYFLFKYYCDIAEEKTRAKIYKKILHDRFPGNPFFQRIQDQRGTALTDNTKRK